MTNPSATERNLIISYLTLRKLIGFLGAGLPFVLAVGGFLFFQEDIQKSMSAYYYTGMRNVFVGVLFVLGFFLLSYRGYERKDDIAGDLAFLFALGVAIFPTAPGGHVTPTAQIISNIHYISAALFYLTLAYFSYFLFTKSNPDQPPTRRKRQRNKVYKACGVIIAVCLLMIGVYNGFQKDQAVNSGWFHPVFWLEAVANVAFGVSWLVKGETLLRDNVGDS